MTEASPDAPPPRSRRLAPVLLLLAFAAGGFLAYRLTAPPRTALREAPAAAPATASAPSAADAAGTVSTRRVPESLPPIALPGLDGAIHPLSEWNGKVRLVNFWATWCEPCRREIPLLRSLRREHARDDLEIIGIAIDTPAATQQYTQSQGIDYPVLVGEEGGLAAATALGMDLVLPFSVFADRQGRIVTLKIGELHRDEVEFILARIADVEAGRLSLAAARARIAGANRHANAAPDP